MSQIILPEDKHPLDLYKSYLDYQLDQALVFYSACTRLLRSLKILQITRPSSLYFVDTTKYDKCAVWEGKTCSCGAQGSMDTHLDGKPKAAEIVLKLPVSGLREWMYNRFRLHCWRWSVRVMTDDQFLAEARRRPEIYYDVFVYPVATEYLTPATTRAALLRWLKLSCPKITYNIALQPTDASCLPRRVQ